MNLKRKLVSLILGLLVMTAIGAFAQRLDDNLIKKDAVTLTGAITITNRMFPELSASGKTYLLVVPRQRINKLGVKDGDQVTVTGNIVELKDKSGPQSRNINGTLVSIDKATVNGKDYNFKDADKTDKAEKGMRMGDGKADGRHGGGMRGPGGFNQENNFTKKDAVTLTGAITVNNRMFPELTASGKTYLLLVPRPLIAKIGVKDSDQVSVTGNIVEPKDKTVPQFNNLKGTLVSVDKATVNGKDYNAKDFAPKGPGHGKPGDGSNPEPADK